MDNKTHSQAAFVWILIAAASRLLPHPPNVTPLAAMALMGGASFSLPSAFALPLAALLASDLILGLHATLPFVYAGFAATVLIGSWLRENRSAQRLALACVSSSLVFFAISNFGTWLTQNMYTHDFSGLVACYAAAIPFLRNSMLGDAAFTGLIFGLDWAARSFLRRQTAAA